MRFFNTAGPIKHEKNYFIPPLERIDSPGVMQLIEQEHYFVLHAPRQTGKTSTLITLRDELNSTGRYRAAYINVEPAQVAYEDIRSGMQSVLGALSAEAEDSLDDPFISTRWQEILKSVGPLTALIETLRCWSASESRPLVLMIDEIDALGGDMLISVLRQLRAGFPQRPGNFPQSVILCGVRDVRDYRIRSSRDNEIITGGSAFNIKAESLRLGDFDQSQTRSLLLQHTGETGQCWSNDALDEVWESTRGQPWLVNALAHEACRRVGDRNRPIGHDDIIESREVLIRRRDTHLDQLADKLRERRVRRVIGPIVTGEAEAEAFRSDDVQYVRDLGLIRRGSPIRIANPIYREVIPRELITSTDEIIPHQSAWFVDDGMLVMDRLLESFQEFFREHSEHWVQRFDYRKAGPQLLLQAFLQRIVNSGGRIEREYGVGRGRTDLLVVWQAHKARQKVVIECKLRRNGLDRVIADGLVQIGEYMDRCGTDEGHLVIFDRSDDRSWDEKVFRHDEMDGNRSVTVWGM
ncbi:MAG: hypothetical protein OXI60_02310 [Acidiferrobacterales bacterium]|nr:hypothetical protein [Acidiferrobacterales bacterium]